MSKLEEAARAALETLETLAKLGAGERYGNSTGNVIAQKAIPDLRNALAEHKSAGAHELSEEELRGAIARGWCSPENAAKEMDVVLAKAIAEEVARAKMPPTAPLSAK